MIKICFFIFDEFNLFASIKLLRLDLSASFFKIDGKKFKALKNRCAQSDLHLR